MNTLYYGDNLKILREYIDKESVDLVYLDPPFNSNRNYNVLFRSESGAEAESQITAFEDTWHWNLAAEQTYNELINEPDNVGRMIESFRQFIGTNQMMAYLVMMAVRLKELHRVLKPTGSLYLHCDPTASHYLKILLDTIFGTTFKNEITWKRTSAHSDAGRYGANTDIIFFYTKSDVFTFNQVFRPYDEEYKARFRNSDPDGRCWTDDNLSAKGLSGGGYNYEYKGIEGFWRCPPETMERLDSENRLHFTSKGGIRLKRYLDELKGVPAQALWDDIPPINSQAKETLGYPTQKPVALLERIISASSNEGDVVLDPFCGCGTTIAAAQKLNRQWIGIDITHLSVGLQKLRLKDTFGILPVGTQKVSPKGTEIIAQGKAEGRNPGNDAINVPDPKGVVHVAPLQVADGGSDADPGFHPGLLSSSPSATGAMQTYKVIGQPEDIEGAKELAQNDRYGFQWWILPLIGARALGAEKGNKEGKKGADKGIDGVMVFTDDNSGRAKRVIVSVKSGHVNVAHIRDLVGTIEREKAAIGVYLSLEPATKPMIEEAVKAGFYHSDGWNKDYPRIQILTVEDILAGKTVQLPPNLQTFKQAGKLSVQNKDQLSLFPAKDE